MKEKEINKLVEDLESLLVYLNAPRSPFSPRGEGAKQAFCVEVYHLFNDVRKKLDKLEDKLLKHYGYDRESIQYVDYYDEED